MLGGHLHLASDSTNNDGVCEVGTLTGGSRIRLARTLLAMSTGSPAPKGALTWTSVSRTSFSFDNDVAVFGDGENLGRGREFQVWVESSAVRNRSARAAASEGTFAVQAASVNVMAIYSATE
jgi:diacylglycerol kinase family enzyme